MGLSDLMEALARKVAAKRVVPPLPPAKVAFVDDDEPDAGLGGEPVAFPLALFIEYAAAGGARSRRRIACKRYEPANHALLAWCFERQANRRFLISRIVSAACVDTGEVLEIEGLVAGLRAGGVAVVDERLNRLLTVLVFLMRCDRNVASEEIDAIERAVTSYALRYDGDDAMIEAALKRARRMAPDGDDFVRALEWIARRGEGPQLARLIQRQAQELIVADGIIASEEAYFGGMVDDILNRIVAGVH